MTNNEGWEVVGEASPHSLSVELQSDTATLEISVEKSQKLKTDMPDNPAISLLGICPKDWASCFTDTCSAVLTAALPTTARKRPKYPSTDGD